MIGIIKMNVDNLTYFFKRLKQLKNQIILDLHKSLYIKPLKLIKIFKQIDNIFIYYIKLTTNNAPLREFNTGNQNYYKYDKDTLLLGDRELKEK